ncbi:hypothetical protein H5398_06580 [Tessaracoccus sp. MC1679]|uniref:hypothetical protein n=1 Tax=Tessaracoccus sp. MC1679 TaxID=2760313 RepID=UPI00160217C7|nr:hypothetical protein [Tessaracoccus sp. MC1679]MBB1515642.1 hypothetical protein [Tessaracoccus sp. MC1679]
MVRTSSALEMARLMQKIVQNRVSRLSRLNQPMTAQMTSDNTIPKMRPLMALRNCWYRATAGSGLKKTG